MITANNFIYTFLGLTDPVPVEYVTTSGFPFVPSELIGLTAMVSFFPSGSSDFGMSSVVMPWSGSWPMPRFTPSK